MFLRRAIYHGLKHSNTRSIFGALNKVFNRVSKERIHEVGPDRACAEWLMRNGALLRWNGHPGPVTHYNNLPLDPDDHGIYYIEEVIAKEASITHDGFDHFAGCHHIISMTYDTCWFFDNECIKKLSHVSNSLVQLKIIKCGEVTEQGLEGIVVLQNLQNLTLQNLPKIKDLRPSIVMLQSALPNCNISSGPG